MGRYNTTAKNNVRIVVQDGGEVGFEFAQRLEEVCDMDSKTYTETGELLTVPTITHMTADQYGRQTATIQFQTKVLPKAPEAETAQETN